MERNHGQDSKVDSVQGHVAPNRPIDGGTVPAAIPEKAVTGVNRAADVPVLGEAAVTAVAPPAEAEPHTGDEVYIPPASQIRRVRPRDLPDKPATTPPPPERPPESPEQRPRPDKVRLAKVLREPPKRDGSPPNGSTGDRPELGKVMSALQQGKTLEADFEWSGGDGKELATFIPLDLKPDGARVMQETPDAGSAKGTAPAPSAEPKKSWTRVVIKHNPSAATPGIPDGGATPDPDLSKLLGEDAFSLRIRGRGLSDEERERLARTVQRVQANNQSTPSQRNTATEFAGHQQRLEQAGPMVAETHVLLGAKDDAALERVAAKIGSAFPSTAQVRFVPERDPVTKQVKSYPSPDDAIAAASTDYDRFVSVNEFRDRVVYPKVKVNGYESEVGRRPNFNVQDKLEPGKTGVRLGKAVLNEPDEVTGKLQYGEDIRVDIDTLQQQAVIVGLSGAGKTTLVEALVANTKTASYQRHEADPSKPLVKIVVVLCRKYDETVEVATDVMAARGLPPEQCTWRLHRPGEPDCPTVDTFNYPGATLKQRIQAGVRVTTLGTGGGVERQVVTDRYLGEGAAEATQSLGSNFTVADLKNEGEPSSASQYPYGEDVRPTMTYIGANGVPDSLDKTEYKGETQGEISSFVEGPINRQPRVHGGDFFNDMAHPIDFVASMQDPAVEVLVLDRCETDVDKRKAILAYQEGYRWALTKMAGGPVEANKAKHLQVLFITDEGLGMLDKSDTGAEIGKGYVTDRSMGYANAVLLQEGIDDIADEVTSNCNTLGVLKMKNPADIAAAEQRNQLPEGALSFLASDDKEYEMPPGLMVISAPGLPPTRLRVDNVRDERGEAKGTRVGMEAISDLGPYDRYYNRSIHAQARNWLDNDPVGQQVERWAQQAKNNALMGLKPQRLEGDLATLVQKMGDQDELQAHVDAIETALSHAVPAEEAQLKAQHVAVKRALEWAQIRDAAICAAVGSAVYATKEVRWVADQDYLIKYQRDCLLAYAKGEEPPFSAAEFMEKQAFFTLDNYYFNPIQEVLLDKMLAGPLEDSEAYERALLPEGKNIVGGTAHEQQENVVKLVNAAVADVANIAVAAGSDANGQSGLSAEAEVRGVLELAKLIGDVPGGDAQSAVQRVDAHLRSERGGKGLNSGESAAIQQIAQKLVAIQQGAQVEYGDAIVERVRNTMKYSFPVLQQKLQKHIEDTWENAPAVNLKEVKLEGWDESVDLEAIYDIPLPEPLSVRPEQPERAVKTACQQYKSIVAMQKILAGKSEHANKIRLGEMLFPPDLWHRGTSAMDVSIKRYLAEDELAEGRMGRDVRKKLGPDNKDRDMSLAGTLARDDRQAWADAYALLVMHNPQMPFSTKGARYLANAEVNRYYYQLLQDARVSKEEAANLATQGLRRVGAGAR